MMKKKSGKRFLSWLLAAVMIIALMPANAFAEPPAESSGNTETPVTFCCPDSEGGADVSVGGYDSSTTAETLFKDISSDVLSFDADSAEDSLKEGTIQETNTPVRLDKAVVLADDNVPKTQEDLAKEGTEISAVIKTDNDITYLPAEGGNPVSLGGDQSLVILYTPQETPSDADADDRDAETKDTPTAEPVKESPVADKTTEGAPAQEGAVENSTDEKITKDLTNEVSAADLAGLTAMFGAPVPMELYAWQSYPVYVYGCFKHNDNYLAENAALYINGRAKAIEWNGDASKGEYYITFGKLTDATTEKPSRYQNYNYNEVPEWKISTANIKSRIAYGEVILASNDIAGSAQKNGLATTGNEVNEYVKGKWSGLKPRKGAEGFPETKTNWSWHIDGTIDVYRVYYTRGTLPKNEEFTPPKESTYFLDDYIVRGQKPTSRNYRFTGWEYKGETYNQGDKVPASNTDITLEAQWAEKEKVYTVNYNWGGNAPEGVTPPTDNKPYDSESAAKGAMDTNFKQGYTHTTNDGTYTFSGWTENVGTTDYSGDEIVTPITFTGTWTFEAKPVTKYKVAYKWAVDSPKDVNLPDKDDAIYNSPEDVLAAVNNVDTTDFKSTEPRQGVAGTWKFDKWEESSRSSSTVGYVTTTTITYTGTWKFTPNPVWKLNYEWTGNQIPATLDNKIVTLPSDDTKYTSEEDALNHKDSTYKAGNYITENGVYTFTGWNKVNEQKDAETNITTIYLKGTWTFEERKYQAVYNWTGNPSNLTAPTDTDKYDSKDSILNSETYRFYRNGTTHKTNDGVYTFSGWDNGTAVTNDEGTLTTITFTGSWTFDSKKYKVVYDWSGGDGVPDGVTRPANNNSYGSESEAKGAMDTKYTNSSTSNTQKDGKEGLWTFSGWIASDPVASEENTEVITFTGSWTFAEKVVNVTYDWGTPAPSDKTCPTGGSYNTEETARNNMDTSFTNASTSNAQKDGKEGLWTFSGWTETRTPSDDGNKILIALTGSWNFTPSETKTITDVLNSLVWKKFESQHGYSTEGIFTATAEVIAKPAKPVVIVISSTTEENVPTDNNAKTFTGTVNLKTGDKKAFTFSAKEAADNVLKPNMCYAVRVSEEKGNLSKVTYDTTKYILTFDTNRNNEVSNIQIAKEKDSESDNPEQESVPVDKITFQNIYTYKRSHSSGDSGNGGGKKEEKPTVEIKDDDALGLNNTDHFAYIVGYGNGEVRPQNSITRAEVAAIFFRLLEDDVRDANYTRQNKFTDVSNDAWYCSAVSTLSAMGIISGYPDATFRPNASITRAEFAAIATRFDVNGDKTPASFNDIAGHWAKDEIAVAANNGWVNGYEDGSFRPQNKITRAETMSLVNRVLNRRPETAEDLLENMTKWTDNADTNAWYYLAVQEATNSHYYEYKENSQYEKWTELRETRDWSELDK